MTSNHTSKIEVKTDLLTPKTIVERNYFFSIPSYQRPYVWSTEEVLGLFKDIKEAYKHGEESYFIGTTLSSAHLRDNNKVYELIDGQQRTTTLMLIAIAFKKEDKETALAKLVVTDKQAPPRLEFSIRKQVQWLINSYLGTNTLEAPTAQEIDQNPYLKQINAALIVLSEAVRCLKKDSEQPDNQGSDSKDVNEDPTIAELGNYIYEHVQWVNNVVPAQMDLNRLFATLNTSGIQLEQTDILKAKLFNVLRHEKRSDITKYEKIWAACEHLDSFFERNAKKVFQNIDWCSLQPSDLATFNDAHWQTNNTEVSNKIGEQQKGLSIANISEELDTELSKPKGETAGADSDYETSCSSIIKFPLLLIHTYRIYLAQHQKGDIGPRLSTSHLLKIFEELTTASPTDVKMFLKLLWEVRYQFDRSVVKWIELEGSDQRQLGLTGQSKRDDKGVISRFPKELSALTMLQSVRYFTTERSTQYWLTPYLAWLLDNATCNDGAALTKLEEIDNTLSLTNQTQKEASFLLAQGPSKNVSEKRWETQEEELNLPNGTNFEHYWFQKLEYLLWKHLKYPDHSPTGSPSELNDKKFKRYRITSKNSVEHIHAQNKSRLDDTHLHSFGNLVLISPGDNSSYSDKRSAIKRAEFFAKERYDSLKSLYIFSDMGDAVDWTNKKIENHQKAMLKILADHYKAKAG